MLKSMPWLNSVLMLCASTRVAALWAARVRLNAPGTVRSQLSQVYAKAEVNGQPMLMSLFLDELIDTGMPLRQD